MKNIVVLYHGECWDGFGGAYAAWKKFGNKADYFGLKHGEELPRGLKNKEIYLIDFSFKEPLMKKIVRENKRVIALDHHVSAEKTTKMAHEHVYALNHSGAVIAWNYFHPKKCVPTLLRHIEDIDLWKLKLPQTRELMSFMELAEYDFKIWDKIVRDLENPKRKKNYVAKGALLQFYEKKLVDRLVQKAALVKFAGYKTLSVNSPILQSEIGAALVKLKPPIGIVWSEKEGGVRVSLRSDGKADVSKIAAKYGGGGHKAAAGFSVESLKNVPWEAIRNPKF
jgi:nanoRNase/pAp phosphatase (c-di-AMP/oligoRNAs hydrolase)